MVQKAKVKAAVPTIEELARTYTVDAIMALAEIAVNGQREQARVAAANALLDRGHGKPKPAGVARKEPDESAQSAQPAAEQPKDAWGGLLN